MFAELTDLLVSNVLLEALLGAFRATRASPVDNQRLSESVEI